MSKKQQTLADFGSTGQQTLAGVGEGEWPTFRDYGATMDDPIPRFDRPGAVANPSTMSLEGTGLAPSDFELVAGQWSQFSAQERGYHPDDEHRPDRLDQTSEAHERAERARDDYNGAESARETHNGEPVATDGGEYPARALSWEDLNAGDQLAIDGERETFTVLKQFREPTGHSVIGAKLLDGDLNVWEFREVRAGGTWYDLRPDDDNAPVRPVPGDRERIQDWERVGHDVTPVEQFERKVFETRG